jgi:hypothetical protein
MRKFVRTDQGAGWVNRAEPITHRGRMFYAQTPVRLKDGDKARTLPAGTIFVHNRALERQTMHKPREERRTHLIVEEGLHHAERLCAHVRSTERADRTVMIERYEDIASISKDLVECGQLSFEIHERLTRTLAEIRKDFDEHKRNDHKETVRRRLDTAGAQKTKAGRFKPAPAALTAFASTAHVRKRLDEIAGIHAAFSADAIEVHAKLEETKACMSSVWIDFQPEAPMLAILEQALTNKTRSRPLVSLACHHVELHVRNLSQIEAMPYRPLADAGIVAARELKWALQQGRVKTSREAYARILELVRRMRMLWFIERSLIQVLSFLPDDGSVPTDLMDRFRDRLGRAEKRVSDLSDHELDPDLRKLMAEYFDAVRTNLKNGDYDRARDELKQLTRELRSQPVRIQASRKAA